MEQETQNENKGTFVAHWKGIIAIAVIVLLLGFIVRYGLTGTLNNLGRVTVTAPGMQREPSAIAPQASEVKPLTEKFIITDTGITEGSKKEAITGDAKMLTAPVNFKSFAYDANTGKIISISGNCSDKYYTFLIFDSSVDYRKDPAAARANRAFECPASKLFTLDMDLRSINLTSGDYYLFIADQGKTGSWYNPR